MKGMVLSDCQPSPEMWHEAGEASALRVLTRYVTCHKLWHNLIDVDDPQEPLELLIQASSTDILEMYTLKSQSL